MMTGADLSEMRPSTELSSVPRGMWTAPGIAPCSYSSGSRTSSTTAPGCRRISSAVAVSTSRISDLAAASSSRKLGIGATLLVLRLAARKSLATRSTFGPGRMFPSAGLRLGLDGDLVHRLDQVALADAQGAPLGQPAREQG